MRRRFSSKFTMRVPPAVVRALMFGTSLICSAAALTPATTMRRSLMMSAWCW
jgi:predicted HicB family RNase H-like nuclease